MEEKAVQIVNQVKELFHRYGIKSVTMDDVSRHLGISKKTLYIYFKDKEELVKQVMMTEFEVRSCLFDEIELKKLNAVDELLEVYKLIQNMFRDYNPSMEYDIRKYYPDLYTKIKSIRRKRMFDSAYKNLNKGKSEGLYRKDLNSKIIARMHVFHIENMFENDLFSLEEISSFKVFHEFFVYHLYGILSQNGRDLFESNFRKFRQGLV